MPFDSFFQNLASDKSKRLANVSEYNELWNKFRALSHDQQGEQISEIMANPHRSEVEAKVLRRWESINTSNLPTRIL